MFQNGTARGLGKAGPNSHTSLSAKPGPDGPAGQHGHGA